MFSDLDIEGGGDVQKIWTFSRGDPENVWTFLKKIVQITSMLYCEGVHFLDFISKREGPAPGPT